MLDGEIKNLGCVSAGQVVSLRRSQSHYQHAKRADSPRVQSKQHTLLIYLSTLFVWKNSSWIFEDIWSSFSSLWTCMVMNGWCHTFIVFDVQKVPWGLPISWRPPRQRPHLVHRKRCTTESRFHGLLGGRYINLPLRSRFKYQKVHPFRYIYIYVYI